MTFPLYFKDFFGFATGLVMAVAIGFAFGFVLERAGFGRAGNLADQFYLRDMRVFKVMFSAIVTAMLGVVVTANLGLLDVSAMQIPETYLWPQIVGGFLVGVGFIISGYCPGTGLVAAASGNLDGVVTVGGVIAGSLAFGLLPEGWRQLSTAGNMGVYRLPALLHVPQAVIAVGVALMAVGCFVGAEWVEQWMAKRAGRNEAATPPRGTGRLVFASFVLVAGLGLVTMTLPPAVAKQPAAATPTRMRPIELARRLVEDERALYVLDTRPRAAWQARHIPGAIAFENADGTRLDLATLSPTRLLVVCAGDGETADTSRFTGTVMVLDGGFAAFDATLLSETPAPAAATAQGAADYRLRAAFRERFTGQASAPPPAVPVRVRVESAPVKKGGGC